MCGIFGIIVKPKSSLPAKIIRETLLRIAQLSESRGKDSSGMAIRLTAQQEITTIKGDIPVSLLIKGKAFEKTIEAALENYRKGDGFTAFGHARLVTNGSQLNEENNQPVIKGDMLVIHNGIIVNVDELWKQHPALARSYSIDTEIIPALLRDELNRNKDVATASKNAFKKLEGTFSVAAIFAELNQFLLATNNGSLYYITDHNNYVVFASEAFFLQKLMKQNCFKQIDSANPEITQLNPGQSLVIDLEAVRLDSFSLSQKNQTIQANNTKPFKINKVVLNNNNNRNEVVIDPSTYIKRSEEKHLFDLLEYNIEAIRSLKRCTKCLLPETFPFIIYNKQGVCNYCHNYTPKNKEKTLDELKALVEPYKSKEGKPDCIVPFSGGRDSTYSLHIIKRELGLNPIAFTYDWGMVTDLARRNIARVCGKLGVENIIVSANIHWKRENIRKNINSWLKKPALGMIPLFMAGDKFFFYYTNKVKKQTGIDLNIWGVNHLENTEFKTGFAGLPPSFQKKRIYSLTIQNQIKLFAFVAKNLLQSPGYFNQSVLDSLGSFASRYIAPKKDYYHLFDYYPWDENEINHLLQHEYNWETAIDTKSTWRIGDGTASFYNYIYYTVAGFSEVDTFRSNQIREGMLDRETALKLTEEENIPRYETLRWYFDIVGVDFAKVINVVNNIPKRY